MKMTIASKYILCVLFFLTSVCLVGQNPFDLQHRLHQTQDTLEKTQEKTTQLDSIIGTEEEVVAKDIETEPQQTEQDIQEEESISIDITPTAAEKAESDKTIIESTRLKKSEKGEGSQMFFIFLLCTIFLALIIAADRSVLNKLYRSLINDNFLSFFMREQKGGTSLQLFFLHTFFIINLGLVGYFVVENILHLERDIKLWQCIAFVASIYLMRHFFMNYLKLFVKAKKEINQFYFTIIVFNIFFGLLIFPLNTFAAFAPEIISNTAIYISVFLFIFIYLARQLRGLFIGSKFLTDHQFHFFIYLCTVEIAPILILGKFFTTII